MAITQQRTTRTDRPRRTWVKGMGFLIFSSRWLQAPLYLGLILAQVIYIVVFAVELYHIITNVMRDPLHIDESVIMLSVLGLIDVVMIANLLIMDIIGGYETFVSRIDVQGHPDQPEWLSHVNANVLKVKLAMAIIGISSIHLLKTFIEVGDLGSPSSDTNTVTGDVYTGAGVFWQVIIHSVFILSAVALAVIDRLSVTSDPAIGTQEPTTTLLNLHASTEHDTDDRPNEPREQLEQSRGSGSTT